MINIRVSMKAVLKPQNFSTAELNDAFACHILFCIFNLFCNW